MKRMNQYWNWWIGQLSDALPTLSTVRKRAAIVAFLDEDVLQLRVRDEPHTRLGDLTSDMSDSSRRSVRAKVESVAGGNRQVVLSVPEEARVQRIVELPLAAEEHLAAVAGNELDRWTPWRTDQAVFSVRVLDRSPELGKLNVEISAVPRAAFAQAFQALQDVDLALIGLLFERDDGPPEFIEVEPDERSQGRAGRRWKALAVVAGCLAILAIAGAFGQKVWAIRNLEERMEPLVSSAEETQKMADEMQRLSRFANYAVRIKQESPVAIVTLNALSRILPDDCWLDSLSLEANKLNIVGRANDALALLPLLSSSGFFRDVAFASEVARDAEAGVDRFSITATVVPYAAP